MRDNYRWEGSPGRAQQPVGGPPKREPVISAPGVVTGLVLVLGAIFIAQSLLPIRWIVPVFEAMAFDPQRFTLGLETGADPLVLTIPLFGHMFLHGDILHILFNSLWLIVFGTGVARRMCVDWGDSGTRMFRSGLFLTFYLICGLVGVMAFYVVQPNSPIGVIGASGAVSGLMGATIRFIVRTDSRLGDPAALAPLTSQPVLFVSIAFILINLATAFGLGAPTSGAGIAWEAHIGGYLAGLLLFPLFDGAIRKTRANILD